MKKLMIAVLAAGCGMAAFGTPPVISNVRASQRVGTKLVDIFYDAADADGDLLKVRVEVSDNDGVKYSIPAKTFTGDVGEDVHPGSGKHIVWDAGVDWDGEYSDKMRVKIYAIDAKGFPGMEWGNEVPPGGFLLGQDGGAEGFGESQHVSIPWSYWMAKYEVTNSQYCDFLNAAIAIGIVGLDGTESVFATSTMPVTYACPIDEMLCKIGADWGIRWNVNKFEVMPGAGDLPVVTTWYGAMAFCRFYGYDLPTEAEWEKAARGPDNDDQDEHLIYPWGNTCSAEQAGTVSVSTSSSSSYGIYTSSKRTAFRLTDVAEYDAWIGGYGLCDVVGNAAEWTRSRGTKTVGTYPTQESLKDERQIPFVVENRVVKGAGDDGLYVRDSIKPSSLEAKSHGSGTKYYLVGFRPVRRESKVQDVAIVREVYEDFETLTENAATFTHDGKEWKTDRSDTDDSDSDYHKAFNVSVGINDGKGVRAGFTFLYLPKLSGSLCFVRMKARRVNSSLAEGLSCVADGGEGASAGFSYMEGFKFVQLSVIYGSSNYRVRITSYSCDEIELWTIPKE